MSNLKRKADETSDDGGKGPVKHRKVEGNTVAQVSSFYPSACFNPRVWAPESELTWQKNYRVSEPFKHAVINELIDDSLLRSVRNEVLEKISFTTKETDIYRIQQSGDLANLDGLDDKSLAQLPSLLKLRNALYSQPFRDLLSSITGAGPVSGRKTDMAINIYTPGCHLLCHDDVIGTRRISYILYLTDPDNPWQSQWGGALRLFPTVESKTEDGKTAIVPESYPSVSIPPAWNQLSFFAVQPGKSFHDVEEVFSSGSEALDAQRVRIAISGWYHIPQYGEPSFLPGEKMLVAKKSSLIQLQLKNELDKPQPSPLVYPEYAPQKSDPPGKNDPSFKDVSHGGVQTPPSTQETIDLESFTESDLENLLKFMNPRLLTPDTVSEIRALFADQSFIRLDDFIQTNYAETLRDSLALEPDTLPSGYLPPSQEKSREGWHLAQPPYKHRYMFKKPCARSEGEEKTRDSQTPADDLMADLFASLPFRKWLTLATGLVLRSHDVRLRRFRRGLDYQLATPYEEAQPRLEITLGITPKGQWGEEEDGDEPQTKHTDTKEEKSQLLASIDCSAAAEASVSSLSTGKSKAKEAREDKGKGPEVETARRTTDNQDCGGYETWMAGDDPSNVKLEHPSINVSADESAGVVAFTDEDVTASSSQAEQLEGPRHDPAIYRSAGDDGDGNEDQGNLFTMAAGFNRLSIVLRDRGTLRFVKYVSKDAPCDRWDIVGEWEVDWEKTDADDDDDKGDGSAVGDSATPGDTSETSTTDIQEEEEEEEDD